MTAHRERADQAGRERGRRVRVDLGRPTRVEDGKTLTTDGPFVAVKEALGGYLVFEADDLDVPMPCRKPVRRAWLSDPRRPPASERKGAT